MGAPKDNQYWIARTSSGRDKIFESPDTLWNAAVEYFEHTSKQVWSKKDWVGKNAKEVSRDTAVPFTLAGFCNFLGITQQTFDNYSTKPAYKDFFEVATRIRSIIWQQKFEGAAVGAYSSSFIAAEIGLVAKKEIDLLTAGKSLHAPLDLSSLSDQDLEMLQQLQERCKPKEI